MTTPNYFGWIDRNAELRNEKRKARQYAAEVGNDISDMDALTLAIALDACMTDPAHILNAETFWVDTEDLTAAAYGDADLTPKIVDGVSSQEWWDAQEERSL